MSVAARLKRPGFPITMTTATVMTRRALENLSRARRLLPHRAQIQLQSLLVPRIQVQMRLALHNTIVVYIKKPLLSHIISVDACTRDHWPGAPCCIIIKTISQKLYFVFFINIILGRDLIQFFLVLFFSRCALHE